MPALAFAIPLLTAAVLLALAHKLPRRLADGIALAVAAGELVICGMLAHRSTAGPIVYWFGGWQPRDGIAVGIDFYVDPFAAGLAALAALLALASFLFSWQFFESVGTLFHVLMLVFLAAMIGFCFAGDIFTMFAFFELMSAAAFALTGHKIEASALEGALNFAITNSIAAFFLLWGIGLLYGRTGALNLAQLGETLAGAEADALVTMAFVLVTTAFLIKGAILPFHLWLADAHAVAPTPVCVLFSGVMVELGLYAVARVWWTVFSGALGDYQSAISATWLVGGAATGLVAGFACFTQRHLKRLLALSTVSHAGIMLMGLGTFGSQSLSGAGIYIVGHALVKGPLFLCAGILLHRFGEVDILKLRGKGRRLWMWAIMMTVAGWGLAGAPPFATFLGKSQMDEAAKRGGADWPAVVGLVASALTAAAVFRAVGCVYFGWGPSADEEESPTEKEGRETKSGGRRVPWFMLAPAAALLLLGVGLGWVRDLPRTIQPYADRFQDRAAYVAAVLDGKTLSDDSAIETGGENSSDQAALMEGFASVFVAIALAALSLLGERMPKAIQAIVARLLASPVRWLEVFHSGRANDYVAWIVVGLAAYALAIHW